MVSLQQQLATTRMIGNPTLTRKQANCEAAAAIARMKAKHPGFDEHSLRLPKLTFLGIWSLPSLDMLLELSRSGMKSEFFSVSSERSETKRNSGDNFMKTMPVTAKKRGVFRGKRGDPSRAKRCLALTRRGTLCQRAAETNPQTGLRKRCRLHGGLSTGYRTPEGRDSMIAANTKHGRYTKAAEEAHKALREKLLALKVQTRGAK